MVIYQRVEIIEAHKMPQMVSFRYLGSIISKDGGDQWKCRIYDKSGMIEVEICF